MLFMKSVTSFYEIR